MRKGRCGPVAIAATAVTLVALTGTVIPRTAAAYHYPWDQGHDTTDWNDPDAPGPPEDPLCDSDECSNGVSTGSPVYVQTGHLVLGENLATLPGDPSVRIGRTYNSNDPRTGIFGNGWSSGAETMLVRTVTAEEEGERIAYVLRIGTGKRYTYTREADGTFATPPGRNDRIVVPDDGGTTAVELVARDGTVRRFDAGGRLIARERADGQTIDYDYDDAGRLTRISAAGGRYFDLAYSSRGFVSTVTDNAGRSWRHDYDDAGNLVRITDPEGGERRFGYRAYTPSGDRQTYHQLTRITDASGVTVMDVTYDGPRVASYTEGENRYDYRYEPGDRTTTKTDRRGQRWTYVYNDHGVIVERTNPAGDTREYAYDDDGNLLTETDPAGETWRYTYDEHKRRLTATDPLGHMRQWEYDRPWPAPTAIDTPSGRHTEIDYDDQAQPIRITDPSGARTRLSYDDNGHLNAVTDALGNTTTLAMDEAGRPLRVTDALGRTREVSYDAAGNVTAITEPDGATWRYDWDDNRRLKRITAPSGDVTRFDYDAAGRRTAVTDPKGQTTSFRYDDHGRLIERTRPDGRSRTLTWRTDNRLASIAHADGTTTTFDYDAAGRRTRIDADGDVTTFEWTARGRLARADNATGTVEREYDAAGRLVRERLDGEAVDYRYNAEGERSGYSALGEDITYERTERGRVAAIIAPEGRHEFAYDAVGRRTQLSSPHGQRVEYAYNAAGELVSQRFSGPHTARHDYTHDAAGRVTRWRGPDFDWGYGYDADGQLTSATSGLGDYDYAYDAAGNRTEAGQRYDSANRLLSDAGHDYSFDARGRLTGRTATDNDGRDASYSWDGRDRLVERTTDGETVDYAYGPLGRRWSWSGPEGEQRFVYAGLDRIATLDGDGGVAQRVTFGPRIDEPLAVERDNGTEYLHAGRLGSILAASDAGGTTATWRYDPFGRLLEGPEEPGGFRYTGREAESTSFYYYRARYYDAGMGRFISEDPIGFGGGDTNLFGYVVNDPVNSIDPLGLATLRCSRGLGGPAEPATSPNGSPFRHDFLMVDGKVYSFQAGDNMFWSQGRIDRNESENNKCETLSEDPEFDEAVEQAVDDIGAPPYSVVAYPGTTPHFVGARNCQTWVDDVLNRAETIDSH